MGNVKCQSSCLPKPRPGQGFQDLNLSLSQKFIKIAPENPVLWTGMKGASAENRKNKPDAVTSSA
jgi:hypothetical protein